MSRGGGASPASTARDGGKKAPREGARRSRTRGTDPPPAARRVPPLLRRPRLRRDCRGPQDQPRNCRRDPQRRPPLAPTQPRGGSPMTVLEAEIRASLERLVPRDTTPPAWD